MPVKEYSPDQLQAANMDQSSASDSTPPPSMLQQGMSALGNFGKGLLKGAGSTLRNIGNLEAKIPGLKSMMPADVQDLLGSEGDQMVKPQGMAQTLGKGTEQAAEFLIPGAGEEAGAAKLASMAPKLGKAALPLAKVATSAIGSGLVNKAQGGNFSTGAMMGAGGQVVGQGLKAAAPALAESGLNITKAMRGRGRDIGQAVLDETSGIRPSTVAKSAKNKISSLFGERQSILDKSSLKPNPVRGLLSAPAQEIPLHEQPFVPGELSRPVTIENPARPMPKQLPVSTRSTPLSSHNDIFPDQLPGATTTIPVDTPADAPGMAQRQSIGQIPGYSGGRQPLQGVLIRPAAVGRGAIPSTLPNNVASLGPARRVLADAMSSARGMEAPTLHGQVSNMSDFLHTGAVSGEAIPMNVTPSRLGRLQQGFSDEHLTWNPNIHERANAAGQRAYGAMTGELERTAPETVPLNSRISNLIPAQRAADSLTRESSVGQKVLGRFGAHTGALAGAGIGGGIGYKEGGVPGALAGIVSGAVAPELIASPEGKLAMARLLNKTAALRPLVGTAAQFTRKKDDE